MSYRAVVLSGSPVYYWRLGESSGTVATDELGTKPGTYSGGFILGVDGLVSGDSDTAVTFNGTTGKVDCGTVTFDNTPFSISLWFSSTTTSQSVLAGRYRHSVESQYRGVIAGVNTDGSLFFTLRATATNYQFLKTVETGFNDGEIHHVVFVFERDGTLPLIYVDGVSKSLSNIAVSGDILTIGPNDPNVNFTIGTGILSTGTTDVYSYFNGTIDEVAIYHSILTESQVLAQFNYAPGGTITGTVYEKNSSGVYIPGAYPVRVYKRSDGSLVASTTSAEDGTYTVSDLPLLDEEDAPIEYYVVALDTAATWQSPGLAEQVFAS